MSAWPEAVWIVRKMKKFFNLDAKITKCSDDLNTINGEIIEISDSIDEFNERIQGFNNIIELQETINQINNRINNNLTLLTNLRDALNNINQTPAIFDTDINDDDLPDEKATEAFADNSLWFVEDE